MEEFNPATVLLAELSKNIEKARAKYGDVYPERRFGTYGDVLLMAYNLPDERWVWAFRDEKLMGRLYFDNEKKILQISRGDQVLEPVAFSNPPNWFLLPADGYGQYK